MVNKIKFFLQCNDTKLRTIADLQENFVIEDVLNYYHNGQLQAWLTAWNYHEQLEAVEQISAATAQDNYALSKELCKIFGLDMSDTELKLSLSLMQSQNPMPGTKQDGSDTRQQWNPAATTSYHSQAQILPALIQEQAIGYQSLVAEILAHPQDLTLIKTALAKILQQYSLAFSIDCNRLYEQLGTQAPLALTCLLMDKQASKYLAYGSNKITNKKIEQLVFNQLGLLDLSHDLRDSEPDTLEHETALQLQIEASASAKNTHQTTEQPASSTSNYITPIFEQVWQHLNRNNDIFVVLDSITLNQNQVTCNPYIKISLQIGRAHV